MVLSTLPLMMAAAFASGQAGGAGSSADLSVIANAGPCGPQIRTAEFMKLSLAQRRAKLTCLNRISVAQLDRTLPKLVDTKTMLESVTASGATVIYHLVVDVAVEELKAAGGPSALMAQVRPKIRDKVCGASDMRTMVHAGTVYRYEWADRNGKPIGSVAIESC